MSSPPLNELDLAVVMPVYNEEECISDVVSSWLNVLDKAAIHFHLLVIDDGSGDDSAARLSLFAQDERVTIIRKRNTGHGPTILLGYRHGMAIADWVFQVDSDGEMPPESFPELWRRRERYDALFGFRAGRKQGIGRWLISRCSRLAIACLYGSQVRDVNVPYRLIRANLLRHIVPLIPEDTFAPNLIISGALSRMNCRLHNHPVPHCGRQTGCTSIRNWQLWKAALKALIQTCACSLRIRRSLPEWKRESRKATHAGASRMASRSSE